jgi:hypothetical protein
MKVRSIKVQNDAKRPDNMGVFVNTKLVSQSQIECDALIPWRYARLLIA